MINESNKVFKKNEISLKIQLFSDIHNYDLSFMPKKTDADVIVCAGDFDMGSNVKTWAKNVVDVHDKELLFCLGNHDYWNTTKESHTVDEWISEYEKLNTDKVHFLEQKTVIINDVALIFATGWSDFDHNNSVTKMSSQSISKDFSKIRTENGKILPDDIYERFVQAKQFIVQELEKHSDKKCVVVTHYPPSISCNTSFNITAVSYYWCGQMEDVIHKYKPVAWISGHMHNPFDRMIDETRVIINPAGNVKKGIAQLPTFKDDLVIDI